MRISFTGAQSAGKTTLLNALLEDGVFEGYFVAEEIPRKLAAQGVKINKEANADTQILIMAEHIRNLQHVNMVTDRCVVDCMVFTHWMYYRGKEPIPTWVFDFCSKSFFHYIKQYDIIFYIKPEFDIVPDGVRSTDKEFRDEISLLFDDYIKMIPEGKVITLTGTVEQRKEQVIKALEQCQPHGKE